MYLKVIGCEEVDCVHVAQDSDKRLAVVYTVMNLQIPKHRKISSEAERTRDGLFCTEIVNGCFHRKS
jgi:hypothetical protein